MKLFVSKYLASFISIALVAVLLVVMLFIAGKAERVQPYNPIDQTSAAVTIETVSAKLNDSTTGKSENEESQESEDDSNDPNDNDQTDELDEYIPPDDGNQEPDGENVEEEDDTGVQSAESDGDNDGLGDETGNTEQSTDNGGENGDDPGLEDDDELRIATDLWSRATVESNELTNNVLPFYAYIVNGEDDMRLTVRYYSRSTTLGTTSTKTLSSGDSKNYEAELMIGSNYFTLTIMQGGKAVKTENITVRYITAKATKDNPTIGDNPPTIVTSLDDWPYSKTMINTRITFTVTATKYDGSPIYSDSIDVTVDGKKYYDPLGNRTYEYNLAFKRQTNEGDYEDHIITVVAWDDEGNSRYVDFTVNVYHTDEGADAGTALIRLDTTTVGAHSFGYDPGYYYSYDLKTDEPASYAIMSFLRELGMIDNSGEEYMHSGTLNSGFYLKYVCCGNVVNNIDVPSELKAKIEVDGLNCRWSDAYGYENALDDPSALKEGDITSGSGWMIAVNERYISQSASQYYLTDGDVLTLRFTLAYGKDIGGSYAAGQTQGSLSSYCGRWINGGYIEEHSWGEGVVTVATCTEAGGTVFTCTVNGCGHTRTENTAEATGHKHEETSRLDPTETENGYIEYTCPDCGDTYRDILPATGSQVDPEPDPEPEPEPEPEPDPEAGENEDEIITGGLEGMLMPLGSMLRQAMPGLNWFEMWRATQ